nr:putative reverse transcriptase, RNA-dependent DNA polymerase [Tanacetum cinerariifolium]
MKLVKNNEAKMVIYNALPRKEYERIFMCKITKEILDTLLITHQGNSQVKDNKIDLLVQQYKQFTIPKEESIDNAFARFNTIITSLKELDEGLSSKNYVRKFFKALHPKWRANVTAIEELKDLTSLSLDELIRNLKVYKVIIKKDFEMVKCKREQNRSLSLKAKKESSDEESLTFDSEDEEYAMTVRDYKFFSKDEEDSECPKLSRNCNQRAFVGGSWSDCDEDEEKRLKKKNVLWPKHLMSQYKDTKTLFEAIQARFGGNDATKKTHRTLLKQMYENFNAPSTKSLDSIFNRLQKIVSQLAIMGETISQEDLNMNNNEVDTASIQVSAASTPVSTVSSPDNTANLSDATVRNGFEMAVSFAEYESKKVLLENISPRNQESRPRNQDSLRKTVIMELTSSKAMVAIDGAGFDLSYMADDEVPTNMALMDFTDSESLDKLIGSQITDNSKTRLGFTSYNAVAPPPTGLFAPPAIDFSNSGIEEFKQPEFEGYGPKASKSVSVDTSNKIKKAPNAQIIKDWISKSDEDESEEIILNYEIVQHKPEQANQPKNVSQNPRNNRINWNEIKTQKLDYDFHDKRMVQKPVLKNMEKRTVQKEVRPVWNNAVRTNHQNFSISRRNFAPIAVLTKSGIVPVSAASKALQEQQHQNLNNNVNVVKANSVNTAKGNKVTSSVGNKVINAVKCVTKKNNVLFTDTECFVLSPNFKLADESQVLLKVHRKNNMYSFDMKNIVPQKDLTCLLAKATNDESMLWHRVLVVKPHFKTPHELFKDQLGKFDGKSDDGIFVGYSTTSKAFREDARIFDDAYDDRDEGAEANYNNLETVIPVSPIPSARIHKDHLKEHIIGEVNSTVQIRKIAKQNEMEPKKVTQALDDESWVEVMQEELLQFKLLNVWTLVDLPPRKRAIGTKWVYRNKKDQRGIVVRNKAKLVAQGHKQEEGIDYDQVFTLVARIEAIRYLKGQPTLGLWYPKGSPLELIAYSDSDYAGSSLDEKSTTRGCQFLGSRLISWQCKKQTIVANSTTEAEYIATSNYYGQVLWLQNQLLDYGYNFKQTKIHVDNESAICVVKNHVYHSKTKHIEIRHNFIRDSYEKRLIEMLQALVYLILRSWIKGRLKLCSDLVMDAQVMKGLELKGYLINDGYANLVQHAGVYTAGVFLLGFHQHNKWLSIHHV